jgi:hypothetical protein
MAKAATTMKGQAVFTILLTPTPTMDHAVVAVLPLAMHELHVAR